MNANARPLSACERNKSLHSAALVAVAVPPKLIGKIVRTTTSGNASTTGIAMPSEQSSRQATTTTRRAPLRIVCGVRMRSPIQLVRIITAAPTKNGTDVNNPDCTIESPRAVCR